MQKLQVMEVHGVRVLTTRQIASMYGTEPEIINNNFLRNKSKYVQEKHFIFVSGEEMRLLRTSHQFDGELKRVSRAYFWTEKGALLHAKSLNTDKAWEVYDYLVDFYFRARETLEAKEHILSVPQQQVQKLTEGDERVLAYNRGVVLGVLRYELEEDSALEIYERLSACGKGMVMKMLFGEVCHVR